MPFSSGTYTAPSNSFNPAVAATTIDPTDWAALLADLSTALSTAICKDGQTTTTALIPFGDSGISTSIIKFPAVQVPSANVNTLDDYEEGTWTPVLSFGGASTGITYSTQLGSYTKIGNRVFLNGTIILSSKGSAAGLAAIGGVPFAPAAVSATVTLFGNSLAVGTTTALESLIAAGQTSVTPYTYSAGAQTQLSDTSFTNTTTLNFSAQYGV